MNGKTKITQEFLAKIKEHVNLVEVVGEHVVLRKAGSNHTGLCPFHNERSPSFSVSEQKQLYHCHGCKKGGDLVRFIMELHGLSFPEAVEELAERASLPMPAGWDGEGGDGDPEARDRRNAARQKLSLAHKLNRFSAAFYHQNVSSQPHIDRYLRRRGVQGDLARNFYVGAAPAAWSGLSEFLVARKAPLAMAVELGLIRPSKKVGAGPGYFDLFRNRAMFPILDLRGKVAGFGGRALELPEGAPDVGSDSPKYLNSPESLVFQKNRLVFGLFQAQKHIREKDEVILVEGYFDVMALHLAGFQNAVATCGTALTQDHLTLFKRLASRVTVLFDGDRAGIAATEKAMELGLEQGLVLYGATPPDGNDPDEFLVDQETGTLREGRTEEMTQLLTGALPLLDARISDQIRKAAEGPEARSQALKRIAGWLERFADPVGREVRAQSAAAQLGVSQQLLEKAGREQRGFQNADTRTSASSGAGPLGQRHRAAPPATRVATSQSRAKLMQREVVLLSALARDEKFATRLAEARGDLPPNSGVSDLFEFPPARAFIDEIFKTPGLLQQFRSTPEIFLSSDLDPQLRSVLAEALVNTEPPYPEEEVKAVLDRSIGRSWARFSQQIKLALADAEARKDAGLQSKLMKEYLDVQRKMKEFTSFYDEA